jgi:hypothetical protein
MLCIYRLTAAQLRLAHSALSGSNTGFIQFFGFTEVFLDGNGRLFLIREPNMKRKFALVFDFATEGTVLDYLKSRLQGSQFQSNWLELSSAMESIVGGISLLHRRGILHR